MTIATTVDSALARKDIDYRVLKHPHTATSMRTAEAAHITGEQIAKAVLLKDERGYLLAVLPATHQLLPDVLNKRLHRELKLAEEEDLERLFYDCEIGAVPPLGPDYGVPTVVEDLLRSCSDIYFEAGDHLGLVQVTETNFEKLMEGAEFIRFSKHAP